MAECMMTEVVSIGDDFIVRMAFLSLPSFHICFVIAVEGVSGMRTRMYSKLMEIWSLDPIRSLYLLDIFRTYHLS